MLTQAPKGTQDVLPQDGYRWQAIEENMRRIASLAGYREVRTPMFEHTELFQRGVGDSDRRGAEGDVHLQRQGRPFHHPQARGYRRCGARLHRGASVRRGAALQDVLLLLPRLPL